MDFTLFTPALGILAPYVELPQAVTEPSLCNAAKALLVEYIVWTLLSAAQFLTSLESPQHDTDPLLCNAANAD